MIELHQGDITKFAADALVNAANSALAGGGGVDGAIHRAGGPSIMEECRAIGHCPTGSAVITGAGNLPARHVIHAVAPRYSGKESDAKNLRGAYARSLELANEYNLRTIAFPSLGTGAYAYPLDEAARIALETVREHCSQGTSLLRVTFVLFNESTYDAFSAALKGT